MALTAHARDTVARRLRHIQSVRDRVVIDADTHPSSPALYSDALRRRLTEDPNYYHGRPISGDELLRDTAVLNADESHLQELDRTAGASVGAGQMVRRRQVNVARESELPHLGGKPQQPPR